jgi:hypothetical protein
MIEPTRMGAATRVHRAKIVAPSIRGMRRAARKAAAQAAPSPARKRKTGLKRAQRRPTPPARVRAPATSIAGQKTAGLEDAKRKLMMAKRARTGMMIP